MRRIYILSALLLLSVSLVSCKKGNGNAFILPSSAKLIIGKWTLQQQHSLIYIDGVKKTDTTIDASQNNYSNAQFNGNGTFTTSGMYSTVEQDNLNSGGSVVSFTNSGTYSFAGTAFNIAGPISGFAGGASFYGVTATSTAPVITPVSNSVKINELTTTKLALHTENIYTYTVNNTSQTYKVVNDLLYTR